MRNSIYDLEFEEVMEIAKESNEIKDRYIEETGFTKTMYLEIVNELCCMHDIAINVYNKCQREFGRYLKCSDRDLNLIKRKFENRKHPYELSKKREQKKIDLLREEIRKELITELGL